MRSKFRKLLSNEIAIEYKACLYFSCILAFYCGYLMLKKTDLAGVWHLWQMLIGAYLMGYLQVYVLGNFDESEQIAKREAAQILLCSGIYTAASWLLGWFGREGLATAAFGAFMILCYVCVYFCNKIKRKIDTEDLNKLLNEYKKEGQHGASGD